MLHSKYDDDYQTLIMSGEFNQSKFSPKDGYKFRIAGTRENSLAKWQELKDWVDTTLSANTQMFIFELPIPIIGGSRFIFVVRVSSPEDDMAYKLRWEYQ